MLRFIFEAYKLTYKDIYVILSAPLSPEQKGTLQLAAHAIADESH